MEDQRGKEVIEQKAAIDAKKRDLCDLRDRLLKILEQKGISENETHLNDRDPDPIRNPGVCPWGGDGRRRG
jgi:hypothetical protein